MTREPRRRPQRSGRGDDSVGRKRRTAVGTCLPGKGRGECSLSGLIRFGAFRMSKEKQDMAAIILEELNRKIGVVQWQPT